jgi:XTP/dITP diphosphohydrolase
MELIWKFIANLMNHWYLSLGVVALLMLGILDIIRTIVCARLAASLAVRLGNSNFSIEVSSRKVSVSSVSPEGREKAINKKLLSKPIPKLLLATNNKAKVREYQELLRAIPFEIVTLGEQGITTVVDEVGGSFEANARLKATTYATESGLLSMADDSGLEVDALGGAPGPLSARYAGEGASDSDRINFLLAKLEDVPENKRTARFRCVIAIATPEGQVQICSGECRGFITRAPQGSEGFGYDPIFYLPKLAKTMAKLSLEVKNKVSHRAQAARKARKLLMGLNVSQK